MEEKHKDIGTPPPVNSSTSAVEAFTPSEPTTSRRRGGGQKRKASALGSGNTSTPPASSSKRQTREKPPPVPFTPIHNGPLTRARQQPNLPAAGPTVLAAAVKSETATAAPKEAGGADSVKANEANEDWEALEAKIEGEYEAIKSRDANAHVVPTHAGWFSWTKVHPLEEKMLASFFNGRSETRTPEVYMETRNWIMKKFHANPSTQIELKDLSELSVGDAETRQEVMEFLEYWGLINFHPLQQKESAPMSIDADVERELKSDTLVESLFHFETDESWTPVIPSTSVTTPALPSGLFPDSALAEELVKSEGPAVEYHCNSCSADCSRKRYHCQKQADFDLCIECFNNDKFGSDMSPSDFILMEPAEAGGATGGNWTDQETLLLLEALELYKENWNEIAEHVATKTKAQCILHFVEMPIEETFLDCVDESSGSPGENATAVSSNTDTPVGRDGPETNENKEGTNENQPSSSPMEISKPEDVKGADVCSDISKNFALKALKEAFEAVGCLLLPGEELSFADAGNPVMTLAAFLIQLVEPKVATATVRNSLKSISGNSSSGVLLATRHCYILEDPPDEKDSADSERTIAKMAELGTQKDEEQIGILQKEEELDTADDQSEPKQKEENPESITGGTDLSNDQNDGMDKNQNTQDNEDSEYDENSDSKKVPVRVANQKELEVSEFDELDNSDSLKKQCLDKPEELEVSPSKEDISLAKDEAADKTTVEDVVTCGSDKIESDHPSTSNPVAGEKKKPGREVAEDKNEKEVAPDAQETTDISGHKIDLSDDKIRRAAITALSAAAVKAKCLARQEEEQIRQLAALLIEKQLYKLETKLAFFNEMEIVVTRVREQLERSKQRLYHERAQIIASRLGMSASTSRPILQQSPINRAAMAFANLAPRPPIIGASLRPPFSRPAMGPVAPSSSLLPAAVPGSSLQPSSQEKLSSVTTK